MSTLLEQLKQYTTVVADTGDFERMQAFLPQDATTNPSLILKAVQLPSYQSLIADVKAKNAGKPVDQVIDALLVAFGIEILKIVPTFLLQFMHSCFGSLENSTRFSLFDLLLLIIYIFLIGFVFFNVDINNLTNIYILEVCFFVTFNK